MDVPPLGLRLRKPAVEITRRLGRPGLNQTRFVGEHYGLDAVAQVELLQDARDVGLHGRLADEELLRDLCVRAPAREGVQDLQLACGQRLELGRRAVARVRRSTSGAR